MSGYPWVSNMVKILCFSLWRETFLLHYCIFVGEYKIVVHPYLNKFRGKKKHTATTDATKCFAIYLLCCLCSKKVGNE